MTEDQARQKWCPMVRQSLMEIEFSGCFNRGTIDDPSNIGSDLQCNCIASDCALWVPEIGRSTQNCAGENTIETISGHCGLINSKFI